MENSIYTVEYFIKKFEAIPEKNWVTYQLFDGDRCCANGHCGVRSDYTRGVPFYMTLESKALSKVMQPLELRGTIIPGYSIVAAEINNGTDSRYQQPTPKQRILAALYDIYEKIYGRKYEDQEQPKEKIIYKTVVIDSAVKTLQETLTEN